MALVYATVVVALLCAVIGALLLRGRVRKKREMQTLLAVMRQVIDDGPVQEKPLGED